MTASSHILVNWKIFLVSLGVLSAVLTINLKTPILPVSGLTFIFFAVFVWFVSMCITLIGLHKLLQHKEPIHRSVFNEYLKFFGVPKAAPKAKLTLKAHPESIKRLTLDIDKYFISKWYCSISDDPDFPDESKVFLEEVLTRLVDVVLQINHKSLLHGTLNIYLKHLKEFRRSLKRKEKYNIAIEELYRYSHVCSNSSIKKTKDYFLHQLTSSLLRHFVNSELWNSLPCHILVSVLARKFMCYLLTMVSNPEVLNYIILNSLASKDIKEKLKLEEYGRISLTEFFDVIDNVKEGNNIELNQELSMEPAVTNNATREVNDNDKDIKSKVEELEIKVIQASLQHKKEKDEKKDNLLMQTSIPEEQVVFRHKKRQHIETDGQHSADKSPKRSDPVKIYESKNTLRTWRDSRDLACVSLGQDPLDALHSTPDSGGKVGTKSVFWESSVSSKAEDVKHDSPPGAHHLFNEVMHITSMEGLKSSIKPISLQDNIENAKATFSNNTSSAKTMTKSVKNQVRKKLEELKKSESDSQDKMSSADSADSVWINPLQIDSPSYDGHILLEKSPKKGDVDQNKPSRIEDLPIPSISTEQPSGTDSPDLEYEDTSDLASSIAKLRCLLQQRSSESSLSTPALSPMPEEYIQKQVESENASDAEALEVDGVMPSFYKFCTKTASGVLSNTINTLKIALPGNNAEHIFAVERWKFKSDQKESETLVRMKKLLTERKEYCILDKEIDTAYDALDSVDIFQQSPVLISNLHFEDELDDFEGKIPTTKVLIDIFCELLGDTNSPLIQEPIVKAIMLALGTTIEDKVETLIDGTMEYLAENLVTIPEKSNINVLSMDIDEYIDSICSGFPDLLKYFFGRDSLKQALKLFVSSIQKQKINEDTLLQMFELVAMKIIEESTLVSPPASA